MKNLFLSFIFIAISFNCKSQQLLNFHDFNEITITGDTISLAQYAGKKLLVVNTASFCGYTHQYEDLQSLYEQ